jgi:hypothetical protein
MNRVAGLRVAFLFAAGLQLAACSATPPVRMLPSVIEDDFLEQWYGNQLRAMHEQPLWTDHALAENSEVIRLLVLPSFDHGFAVKAWTSKDGKGFARVVVLDGKGGYAPGRVRQDRKRELTPTEVKRLADAVAASDLWKYYPEEVAAEEGGICLDGIQVVLERRNAQGHSFSHANISCAATKGFRAVMDQMLEIGRFEPSRLGYKLK